MPKAKLRNVKCVLIDGPQDGYECITLPEPKLTFTDPTNRVIAVYERISSIIPPVHYRFVQLVPFDDL